MADQLPRRLAAHVDDDVAAVLAEVRAEAVRRVRDRLVDAYVGMLDERLHAATPERAAASPRRAAAPRTAAPPSSAPATRPPQRPGSHPDAGETGCYVYAVVAGDGTGAGAGSAGVQQRWPVEVVNVDDLSAVVSTVSLAALRELMSDEDVTEDGPLARAVRTHDAVVDTAFRAGPVVPLRFGTVLPDRDAVAGLIRRHAAALRDELGHLSAGSEWGVKLYGEHEPAGDADSEDEPVDTGRDYLLAKSRRRAAVKQAAERRASAVAAIHDGLAAFADDAVLAKPTAGGQPPLLLNASYLVRTEDEARFLEVLDRLSRSLPERGFRIERTGPWPPYHFVRLDLSQDPR